MKPKSKQGPSVGRVRGDLKKWRGELMAWHAKGCPPKRVTPTVTAAHIALLGHALGHLQTPK